MQMFKSYIPKPGTSWNELEQPKNTWNKAEPPVTRWT